MSNSKQAEQPQWMMSFADLLSLILTFFVLIYSMAQPMQFTNNFKRDNNSFITVDIDTNFSNITTELKNMQLSNEYIAHVFADKIKQTAILQNFEFKNQGDDFVISMRNDSLNDANLRYLSQFIKPYKGKKNVYAAKLEDSYKLSNSLLSVGSNEPIGIYERRGLEDRIDIIISP